MLPFEPFCPVAGGATLGFRREVFEAVGGFDPAFAAQEDTDFCIRAHLKGFEIRMVPDAVYNYRFRDSPEAIYRQAYAYTRAEALLRRRYMAEPRFLAPRPWLSLASRSARLSAEWLKARALRRQRSLLERARFNRRLGTAMGSLAGSLAYRVAPRIPGGSGAPRRPLLQPLLRRLYGSTFAVATDERLMALTFDDGPDPEHTPRLLELLARHGAKATFFMVGARAARHPELVARVAAEGHEIGNHGWDHPSLPGLPSAAVAGQLERTRAVLAPHGQALMRPPYGHQDLRTHRIARRLGYRPVFWSITGEDWRGHDAATIAGHILERAAPGAIVLLHDSLFAWEEAASATGPPASPRSRRCSSGCPTTASSRSRSCSAAARRGGATGCSCPTAPTWRGCGWRRGRPDDAIDARRPLPRHPGAARRPPAAAARRASPASESLARPSGFWHPLCVPEHEADDRNRIAARARRAPARDAVHHRLQP